MSFLKGVLKYSGLLMLSGWMFFMGLLVGRDTAPIEFDTGWFQERLAVIFDDSQPEESVLEKPELDFYAALQKSDLKEDYDLKLKKPSVSEEGTAVLSEESASELTDNSSLTPLKKSRKAMTSKLSGKQISSVVKSTSGGEKVIANGDLGSKGGDTTSKRIASSNRLSRELPPLNKEKGIDLNREGKSTDSVDNHQPLNLAARSEKTKSGSQVEEIKSGQVKGYDGTAYSYTIQIASFPSETDALSHIAKLGEKGYSAYKSSGMVGDKTWYRIRIGSFNNITEAKESLKKLEASGIKGLIIQKD